MVATLVVGVLALVRSGHGLHTPFQPLHGHSPGDFLEAVALGVFLYSAFEWVTTSAEEVRKPDVDQPRHARSRSASSASCAPWRPSP